MGYVEDHGPANGATSYCHGCKTFHPLGSKHRCGGEHWNAPEAGIGQEDDQSEHRGTDPVGEAEGSGGGNSNGQGEEEQEQAAREVTFEDTFHAIFAEAFDILVERQRKYGPENVRHLGLYGVFTRLAYDKVERLRRAMNGVLTNGEVELDLAKDFGDESFDDTLIDIANYALIMVALRRGVWGRPLA